MQVVASLSEHCLLAAALTFAACSLLEMLICRVFHLGEAIIGKTIVGGAIKVILVLLFYTVFGATALFAKATGKTTDPSRTPGLDTYWQPRETPPATIESMRKQ